jgi:hypothetical protein
VPESGTEVFDVHRTTDNASTGAAFDVGFVSDFAWHRETDATAVPWTFTRLLGGRYYLRTDGTNAEGDSTVALGYDWTLQNSVENNVDGGFPHIFYNWKRAPGFFDVVAYEGDNTVGKVISHNLGVAPEMIWTKLRDSATDWVVWHSALGNNEFLKLNTSDAKGSNNTGAGWLPTSTTFNADYYMGPGANYATNQIAYLFASLPGISKVGSFTHTINVDTSVDCGFTSGARFVLIKRTDSTSNWYVFDTARGIASGSDKALFLDNTNAEQTADWLEPSSSGFIVNGPNWNSGSYIFYAIA